MKQQNEQSPFRTNLREDNDSPNRQKMRLLSEKWSNISQNIDKGKIERKEDLELKIRYLEERINSERPQEDAKLRVFKEQVLKLQEALDQQRSSREVLEEKKQKEIRQLEEQMSNQLEEEKSNKRSVESTLLKQTDDKFNNLNLAFLRNNKEYEQHTETRIRDVVENVNSIKDQIELEKRKREESISLLTDEIENELNKFHDVLLIEKKVREETQTKIYRMIEEIHLKLTSELNNERRERETTQDSLIKLLEDTCGRIDQNFQQ